MPGNSESIEERSKRQEDSHSAKSSVSSGTSDKPAGKGSSVDPPTVHATSSSYSPKETMSAGGSKESPRMSSLKSPSVRSLNNMQNARRPIASPTSSASSPVIAPSADVSPALSHSGSRRDSYSSFSDVDEDLIPLERISFLDLLDPVTASSQLRKKLNKSVKRHGNDIRSYAKAASSSLNLFDKVNQARNSTHRDQMQVLFKRWSSQVDKFADRMSKKSAVTKTEKLTFCLALLNIFYLGWTVGRAPQYFHIIYSTELAILLPIRIYTYRRRLFTYYLVDLCYFVNILCLLFIWVWPSSEKLYVSCFALTFGTLSWAVVTWRNSLVLHSIEKTTSTFIHVLPPVVFHVITHIISPEYQSKRFPGAANLQKWNFVASLIWTSVAYFTWQLSYHYFITVRRKDKIKAGRVTSFEYLRKAYSKKPIGKFVNSLPEPFPVVAFTMIQYGYQLSTMTLCPLWYSSSILASLFLTTIFTVACYNGATYYIDIFGMRFSKEVEKLQAEIEKLQLEMAEFSPPVSGAA